MPRPIEERERDEAAQRVLPFMPRRSPAVPAASRRAALPELLPEPGGCSCIRGAARAGLLVAADPRDPGRRVLAVTKSNLGPVPPSLAYRVVHAEDASRVEWEGPADCSARDLLALQVEEDGDGRRAREDAEGFLQELLAEGAMPAKDVDRERQTAGISERTTRRAKARLGVRVRKEGSPGGGRWVWSLP